MSLLLLLACAPPPATALVAPDRAEHLLARPFPSDELLNEAGAVELTEDFPLPGNELGDTLMSAWLAQMAQVSFGFSPQTPIAFHLAGDPGLAERYAGEPEDPVQLFRAGKPSRRVPIELKWVPDAGGDPYLLDGTLLVRPQPGHPLSSGRPYVAAISEDLVAPAEGWSPPAGAGEGWGVATRFTVQDSATQLFRLQLALIEALEQAPELLEPSAPREVAALRFAQGLTASGHDATVFTVTYADGGAEETYLTPGEGVDRTLDLSEDPYRVYEARIRTLNFQGPEDKPYSSPGLGFLADGDSTAGWIHFDAASQLLSAPVPEEMRILIQVPRAGVAGPVLTWDHGSNGHAYNAVARKDPADGVQAAREALAEAGVVIVSHDMNLYGQRYDLVGEGYADSLGFYNVVSLPTFRDNQRQLGVDHYVMGRFVQDVLPGLVEGVDPGRVGAFGHSLGTVSAHLGLGIEGGSGANAALMSGTGAYFIYAVLETGLLTGGSGDSSLSALLMSLLDVELPEPVTGQLAAAALLGLPEDRLDSLDRFHPALLPFQTLVDPSDPLALTQRLSVPETLLMGLGDRQTPNTGTRYLAEALDAVEQVECAARGDYDPHYCTWREPEGLEAIRGFAEGL
ncbi:MAG: hypothetical protein H6741_20330 [Alphaproteobacteria bacterium]|nr:hypothetical protein [Alphaproteobacteria bacterium]